MCNKKEVRDYILQRKSIFTVESTKDPDSPERRTYMFKQQTRLDDYRHEYLVNVWNIYLLYGPDNTKDYKWIGVYDQNKNIMSFNPSPKAEGYACKMIMLFMSILLTTDEWPETCRFYRSTRCCRCGRRLTTPESIATGYGPHCYRETNLYE